MNRKEAEKKYAEALSAVKKAESVSESAYEAAHIILDQARKQLVNAEINEPTFLERKRQNDLLYMRSRGLDF